MQKRLSYIISIVFLFFIFLMFCLFLTESRPLDVKSYFNSDIHWKEQYIDIFGAAQGILNKKAIEDFSIFKDRHGKMTRPYDEIPVEKTEENVEKMLPICDYCNRRGIPYLYLTSLFPIANEDYLPYLSIDFSHANADQIMDALISNRVNVFDLRQLAIEKEDCFYRTDHHWTTDTAFAVFEKIAEKLHLDYPSDYNEYVVPQSFLGSYGIKVGRYYAGKDDFKIFVPKEKGQFVFESYNADGNCIMAQNGPWFDTLIDREILENENYNNKYNSWLYSQSTENRIINKSIDCDNKLLLISHSYGRPLASYLSLCFHEVRQLDPQEGRFVRNYLDYIDDYQPDMVLFLVEFEGDLIGEYNTER